MKIKRLIFCCLLILTVFYTGCRNNNPVNPKNPPHASSTDFTPMWPMYGYNASHSSNPFGTKHSIAPVLNGQVEWIDTLGEFMEFSNASNLTIDALGNIYMMSTKNGVGRMMKFKYNGDLIWSKDSLFSNESCGIALSNDESKLYYIDMRSLTCLDSSGNRCWSILNCYCGSPAIDKDGTIYASISGSLSAVSPDGNIKWSTPDIPINGCFPSLDRNCNLYIFHTIGASFELMKYDNNGIIKWRKTYPYVQNFSLNSVVIDGYNNLYFKADSLYSLDKDGNKRWSKCVYGNALPAITSDNKIISDSSNYIIKMDTSGKVIWKTMIPDNTSLYIGLDSINNIYCNYGISICYSISVDKDGGIRWNCLTPDNMGFAPGPVLSTKGKLVCTPKRNFLIYSVW